MEYGQTLAAGFWVGLLVGSAMLVLAWQAWKFDFSEPQSEPDWELNVTALNAAVTNTPEVITVEFLEGPK